MIPVVMQPEPDNFDIDVRQPGKSILSTNPTISDSFWKRHSYWGRISKDLYNLYRGICAYTGEWFPRTTTRASLDHFIPKSIAPSLAYEWSNYRLTTQKVNENKKGHTIIADPFEVRSGWFVLSLPGCYIVPGENLSSDEHFLVEQTINILKLNNDDSAQSRCDIILDYINGYVNLDFLQSKYPYIAHELTRQNMLDDVKAMFKPLTHN